MSGYELTMSLAVRHPDIDPDHITRALSLEPGHSWRRGEGRIDEAGASMAGTRRASYWLCEIAPRHSLPNDQVVLETELLRVLRILGRASPFLRSVHDQGGATELQVTLFARGDFQLDISPEICSLLGKFPIALRLDVRNEPANDGMAA